MNRINMNKIYIIAILFIVLLPNISMAFANGSGTFNDPYMIGKEDKIVYSETNGSFYFKVYEAGTYQINIETAMQTVAFKWVADDELSEVANNAVGYAYKQLGVKTIPDTSDGSVTPKYNITDESRYLHYDNIYKEYRLRAKSLPLTNACSDGVAQEDYYFFTESRSAKDEQEVFDPLFVDNATKKDHR